MKIGDKVRDQITGFEGVVTGRCQYITGCEQALVQPPVSKDGTFVEAHWFDEDRLAVVEMKVIQVAVTKAGPDAPAPVK